MGVTESDSHLERVEIHVKSFLGRCKLPAKPYSIDPLYSREAHSSVKKASKLPLICPRRTITIDTLTLSRNKSLQEWDDYKREGQIQSDGVIDALKWWHSKRSIYPNLFRLALPLLYSKISTCGVERSFSISGKLMRKDRRGLDSESTKRTMLLRNRFTNYGFFDEDIEICNSANDESLIVLSDSTDDERNLGSDEPLSS